MTPARALGMVAVAVAALSAAPAAAQEDPYRRRDDAPVPPPDEARGWRIEPRAKGRPAVKWVKRKTKQGARLMVEAVIAPIKGAVRLNDRYEIVDRVEAFLYNEPRTAAMFPQLTLSSGFAPRGGFRAFHRDLAGGDERLELQVSFGGADKQSYQLSLFDPGIGDSRIYAETLVRFERDDQLIFRGIGHPPSVDDVPVMPLDPREGSIESRFFQQRTLLIGGTGVDVGRRPRIARAGLSVIYNHRRFDGAAHPSDPSIEQAYAIDDVVGFGDTLNLVELTLDLTIDTRDKESRVTSGWRAHAFAGGVPPVGDYSFFHYGGEAAWHQQILLPGRVVVFRAALEGVAGKQREIPFTELPRLGGNTFLRGYRRDRFRDRIAVLGTIEYRYPIHHFVSGMLFFEGGKVGRTYDELFRSGFTDNWQPSFGGGFIFYTIDELKLRLDITYGDGFHMFFSTDPLRAFENRREEL